jgi:hypothetical protein
MDTKITKYELCIESGILSLNYNLSKQVLSYEDFMSYLQLLYSYFCARKKSDPLVKKDMIFPCMYI